MSRLIIKKNKRKIIKVSGVCEIISLIDGRYEGDRKTREFEGDG